MEKVFLAVLTLSLLAFAAPAGAASDTGGGVAHGAMLIAAVEGNDVMLPRGEHDRHRDREVLGVIVSINKDRNEIVINDDYTHLDTPVILHEEDMSKVEVGDEVKVVLARPTNVARTVIIEEKRPPESGKSE